MKKKLITKLNLITNSHEDWVWKVSREFQITSGVHRPCGSIHSVVVIMVECYLVLYSPFVADHVSGEVPLPSQYVPQNKLIATGWYSINAGGNNSNKSIMLMRKTIIIKKCPMLLLHSSTSINIKNGSKTMVFKHVHNCTKINEKQEIY